MTRRQWLLSQLLICCFGLACGEYLGCYKDSEDRLMKGFLLNLVLTLTPHRCVDLCTSKGFQYAGLKDRISCFCDQQKPPHRFRSKEVQCQATCVGDNTKICGGDVSLSVYSTRLAQNEAEEETSSPDSFVGCYKDNTNARLLSDYFQELNHNTPEKCKALCYRFGYLYSGVESGVQCFCGDTHPHPALLRDRSQCSMACPGDPGKNCGGSARLSIHETGITDIPALSMKLGCFDDEDPRVLDGFKIDLEATNSPHRCLNLCRSLGYHFSGVEFGKECFCGNTVNANTSRDSEDEECSTTCPGDIFETCGANWKLMVYRTGLSDPEPEIKRMGCFVTDSSLLLKGFRQDFVQPLTLKTCTTLCYNKGFLYATILSRTQCWCDSKEPSQSKLVKDEDCQDINAVVFETGHIRHKDNYIGCFSIERREQAFRGIKKKFEGQLTPNKCSRLCFSKGYLYSGTNHSECFCGDEPEESSAKVGDEECSSSCSGDRSKYCGGPGKLSLYSTGISDVPITANLIGCFIDEIRPRALEEHKTDFDKTNSPQRCLNYCLQLGFKFAGVEYQKECFCGNSRPNSRLDAPDKQCNSVCSGDSTQTCGGGWRMEVYRTGNHTTTEPPSPVITPKPPTPVLTSKPPTECELSQTLVNGKAVCRGDIVFRDAFTTSSIAGHWQHVIKIADAPDYEFVAFTSDPNNSFHRDGKLVIKPTLLADKDVQEGSISLEGCTGLSSTRECEMKAFSFNILPPVRSARLDTQRSFSFRYGIVEIRARLPAGDWLVPELWLLPKDQSYGSNYHSGKVRVAMSRGNRYLTSNGRDIGSSTLVSGVLVGSAQNVSAKAVINRIFDSWYSSFRNYTLVWTPDNLSFYVDGQSQQALLPPSGRLTELMGLTGRGVAAWNTGSRIAPFDTDFYLSLGLSAGGMRDFPDGCVSRDKEKPWTNFKVKAMLNFWLDRETWKPSWDEDKSSLVIEHVQVTAL